MLKAALFDSDIRNWWFNREKTPNRRNYQAKTTFLGIKQLSKPNMQKNA